MLKLKLLLVFCLPAMVLSSGHAAAFDIFGSSCQGQAANSPTCQDKAKQIANGKNPIGGPDGIIQKAANILALVAGISAVIIIIISGLMFATAGGAIGGQRAGDNPTKAKNARAALIGAVIGLLIVAFAWTITSFVTNNFIHS